MEEMKFKEKTKKYLYITSTFYAIVYLSYVLTNDIPYNPAGFYISSIEQIISNGFELPEYVNLFGEGIPFAYPPLAFYVSAAISYVVGSTLDVVKYVPGIVFYLQSLLLFVFVKSWTDNEEAGAWAFILYLLMPYMITRSLYGDGITTTMSGFFMFLSWICATSRGGYGYKVDILGGIGVGASILSHPIIGVFCALGYVVVKASEGGEAVIILKKILITAITSLVLVLPWVAAVVYKHGSDPFIAGLSDGKSGLHIFKNPSSLIDYILIKYTGQSSFLVWLMSIIVIVPYLTSTLYCILSSRTYITLLIIASLVSGKGHPLVLAPIMAMCGGIFFSNLVVAKVEGYQLWRLETYLPYVASAVLFLGVFSYYANPFTKKYSFPQDKENLYAWIRGNTKSKTSILKKGRSENIPFFTGRKLLYPVFGAEWVPSATYRHGRMENKIFKQKFFECIDFKCFLEKLKNLPKNIALIYPNKKEYEKLTLVLHKRGIVDKAFENGRFLVVRPTLERRKKQ